MEFNSKDINASWKEISIYLYIFTIALILLSLISDLLTVQKTYPHKINNITAIFIVITSIIVFLTKSIPLHLNYCIISYTILANILISNLLNIHSEDLYFFLLRDTLSIILLAPILGIVVNKVHTIIFASLFMGFYTTIVIITGNIFLEKNLGTICILVLGYSICMYFVILFLERSLSKQKWLNNQVNLQNQELTMQAKTLGEINQLLSKQTIEIRTQQEEFKKLNSTKDKFMSLFAHDLKSLMSSIIGFSQILEKQYDNLSEEKRKKFISIIKTSSVSTYSLLENLLEWSRSQSNNIAYSPTKIKIGDIVNDVFSQLEPNARKKQIALIDSTNKNTEVFADKYMITTVLRNLASNAIKYSKEGSNVEIGNKITDSSWVELTVSDNGVGMTEEQVKSLFKIENAESTVGTKGEKGTGLGLLICVDFIKKHNSSIHVKSSPGKGSVFSFKIDLAIKEDS